MERTEVLMDLRKFHLSSHNPPTLSHTGAREPRWQLVVLGGWSGFGPQNVWTTSCKEEGGGAAVVAAVVQRGSGGGACGGGVVVVVVFRSHIDSPTHHRHIHTRTHSPTHRMCHTDTHTIHNTPHHTPMPLKFSDLSLSMAGFVSHRNIGHIFCRHKNGVRKPFLAPFQSP